MGAFSCRWIAVLFRRALSFAEQRTQQGLFSLIPAVQLLWTQLYCGPLFTDWHNQNLSLASTLFLDLIAVLCRDGRSSRGNASKLSCYRLKAIVIHSWRQRSSCRNGLDGRIEAVAGEIIPTCIFMLALLNVFYSILLFSFRSRFLSPFAPVYQELALLLRLSFFADNGMKMHFKTSGCPERERSYSAKI